MKIGDLVKTVRRYGSMQIGLITDIIEKKCWRTDELGKTVNWNKVQPEPHAVVLVGEKYLTIPLADLELIDISLT